MSDIGWVIYSREDAEKNKGFIRMLKEDFDQYNVELKLVILEEIDKPEVFVKNANIDFAIDVYKRQKLYLVNENNNYMIIDYKNNSYKSYDKNNLSNELEKIFDSTKMIKLQKINYETLGSDEPALIIDH